MIVQREDCLTCHRINNEGDDFAPDLSRIGSKHPAEWFKPFLLNPQRDDPDSPMPPLDHLTDEEMADLVAFLSNLK